jgi:hypothetical protein
MTTHGAAFILPPDLPTGRSATAEQRLMRAVLDDALDVLLDTRPHGWRGRTLRADTEHWLLANDVAWPFSFLNVCRVLGVDPASIRQNVESALEGREHLRPAA